MTATLETRATEEDFATGLEIPRDVPVSLLEMPRGLGLTEEDFGFTAKATRVLSMAVDDEGYAKELERAKYVFVRAMIEQDIVTILPRNKLGKPILRRGKNDPKPTSRSRWVSPKIRIAPAIGKDALENHWVEFVKVYWEELLPFLVFTDPSVFTGRNGKLSRKEWLDNREEDPVVQKRIKWARKAWGDYTSESTVASQVETVKNQLSDLPATWIEIEQLHFMKLKSLCKKVCGDGGGNKEQLSMRLADKLEIEIPIEP